VNSKEKKRKGRLPGDFTCNYSDWNDRKSQFPLQSKKTVSMGGNKGYDSHLDRGETSTGYARRIPVGQTNKGPE